MNSAETDNCEPQPHEPSDTVTPTNVIEAFRDLTNYKYRPYHPRELVTGKKAPSDLLISDSPFDTDDLKVTKAITLHRELSNQYQDALVHTQDQTDRDYLWAKNSLIIETILTDAGFFNPEHVESVLYEKLLHILEFAQAAGFDDIASEVQAKVVSLNNRLPTTKKLQGTILAQDLLREGLVFDKYAALLSLDSFHAVNVYARTWRAEPDARNKDSISIHFWWDLIKKSKSSSTVAQLYPNRAE